MKTRSFLFSAAEREYLLSNTVVHWEFDIKAAVVFMAKCTNDMAKMFLSLQGLTLIVIKNMIQRESKIKIVEKRHSFALIG